MISQDFKVAHFNKLVNNLGFWQIDKSELYCQEYYNYYAWVLYPGHHDLNRIQFPIYQKVFKYLQKIK